MPGIIPFSCTLFVPLSLLCRCLCLIQWDISGHERFRSISNAYFRGADGVVLVYDVTDRVGPLVAFFSEVILILSVNPFIVPKQCLLVFICASF